MEDEINPHLSQNTIHEIFKQPDVWLECLQFLQTFNIEDLAGGLGRSTTQWMFVGCGTSYYLAQAAAASFRLLAQYDARALPASELLLYPELSIQGNRETLFEIRTHIGDLGGSRKPEKKATSIYCCHLRWKRTSHCDHAAPSTSCT